MRRRGLIQPRSARQMALRVVAALLLVQGCGRPDADDVDGSAAHAAALGDVAETVADGAITVTPDTAPDGADDEAQGGDGADRGHDAGLGPALGWQEPAWLGACAAGGAPDVQIVLRWSRFYAGETQARVSRGLLWLLHWLGASLPAGCEPQVVTWLDGRRLRLSTAAAGLPPRAACVLRHLAETLQASEEALVMGGVDVGRFVSLAIGVPGHYYAAVGMPKTIDGFRALHPDIGALFAVLPVSLVAFGPRRIEASAATYATSGIAWLAAADIEWEAIDALPNGALRYGVYGHDGQLAAAGDPSEGFAGKPSRCLWCHEGLLTRQLTEHEPLPLPGALDRPGLAARISADNALLRADLAGGGRAIHPEIRDEHSQGELLYAGFLEPSATRLAIEWGLPRASVMHRLAGLATHHEDVFHVDSEEVYDRWQVDALAPYAVVPAPRSIHFVFGPDPDLVH